LDRAKRDPDDSERTPEVIALREGAERLMAARQAAKRARAEKPQP
jgi:hypothetical protein